jgi:hypothetical protein
VWHNLVVFNSLANDFDDDDYRPELSTKWLNPVELEQRIAEQELERDRLVRGKSTTTISKSETKNNVPMQPAPRVEVVAEPNRNRLQTRDTDGRGFVA